MCDTQHPDPPLSPLTLMTDPGLVKFYIPYEYDVTALAQTSCRLLILTDCSCALNSLTYPSARQLQNSVTILLILM